MIGHAAIDAINVKTKSSGRCSQLILVAKIPLLNLWKLDGLSAERVAEERVCVSAVE
jgi:hypothetical protein